MPPTRPRRKRPHPARRTRRAAGCLSVAALAGLTGCMASAGTASPSSSATSSRPSSSSPTSTTPATSDDGPWWSRSDGSGAIAGSTSSQPVTSSRAS